MLLEVTDQTRMNSNISNDNSNDNNASHSYCVMQLECDGPIHPIMLETLLNLSQDIWTQI